MFSVMFLDIDTQRDFIEEKGAIPVPDAPAIRDRLRDLAVTARDLAIPILASCDAHAKDDPQFRSTPAHCVIGTRGQEKIPETWVRGASFIPSSGKRRPWVNMKDWKTRGGQIIVEKVTANPFDNPATESLLRTMEPHRVVVYGVPAEEGVWTAVENCLTIGIGEVYVVSDAIKGRTKEGEHKARIGMATRGAKFAIAHDLCLMAAQWMTEKH